MKSLVRQQVSLKDILVLTFKKTHPTIESVIYEETLDHIATQLSNIVKCEFYDNQDLLNCVKDNNFSPDTHFCRMIILPSRW